MTPHRVTTETPQIAPTGYPANDPRAVVSPQQRREQMVALNEHSVFEEQKGGSIMAPRRRRLPIERASRSADSAAAPEGVGERDLTTDLARAV